MILIAHRGNTRGPNPDWENNPDYIYQAIEQGFDVEVDIRLIDDEWWLGHDRPQYKINDEILNEISLNAWLHCKNLAAMEELTSSYYLYNAFWHQADDYTLTSRHFIWCYPGVPVPDGGISVLLGDPTYNIPNSWGGVCSDYVESIRERMV